MVSIKVRSGCNAPSFSCFALLADMLTTPLSFANSGVTSMSCAPVVLLRPIILNEAIIGSTVDAFNVFEIRLLGSASCERT